MSYSLHITKHDASGGRTLLSESFASLEELQRAVAEDLGPEGRGSRASERVAAEANPLSPAFAGLREPQG